MTIKNKKVLITGADGFIGSHLAEILVHEGASVRALSHYNSFNSWGWLEDTDCLSDMEVITGDIRDSHFCNKLCKGIDYVFHLAALIAIPYSYSAPGSYIDTNINGTMNICQAALTNDCQRIMHTSTSEVYGTAQTVPISESHPLQPQSPYSASKIGADAIALSFHNSFGLPLTIARPFNTFGPRQSCRAIIPTIITQLAAGASEVKVGDLRPTRDFNFVRDTAAAMLTLALSNLTIGETVNIGTSREISIGDLFNTISNMMGLNAVPKVEERRIRPANSEVMRLCCDSSKLRSLTGFKHTYTLEDGLESCIEWYTIPDNLDKFKCHIYNL